MIDRNEINVNQTNKKNVEKKKIKFSPRKLIASHEYWKWRYRRSESVVRTKWK